MDMMKPHKHRPLDGRNKATAAVQHAAAPLRSSKQGRWSDRPATSREVKIPRTFAAVDRQDFLLGDHMKVGLDMDRNALSNAYPQRRTGPVLRIIQAFRCSSQRSSPTSRSTISASRPCASRVRCQFWTRDGLARRRAGAGGPATAQRPSAPRHRAWWLTYASTASKDLAGSSLPAPGRVAPDRVTGGVAGQDCFRPGVSSFCLGSGGGRL